jgi:hypothetical protein
MTSILRVGLCAILTCFSASAATTKATPAAARRAAHADLSPASGQLGTVNFPTSCNAAAQTSIVSGVALMHSFQYQQSEAAFKQAASADPKCAMAKWGEAMALYHQLWDNPDADALKTGHADIAAAEKLHAATPREQGYIDAASAYFKDGDSLTYKDRVQAYSDAMAKVHAANPDDVDAASLYALSLVSLAYKDEKNSDGDRKQALAILLPLFATNPDHPGVAHYIIHAADTPALAPQALEAARRYAKIAPDSSHALHMPAHTFTRLGLWQESIDSNVAASAAAAKSIAAHESEPHYQFHAMDFLAYSYVQMGQGAKAEVVLTELKNVAADKHHIEMRKAYLDARHALDMRDYKRAADLPVLELEPSDLVATYWAKSIGSARSGNAAAAKESLAKLIPALAARAEEDKRSGDTIHEGKPTEQLEAEGWLAFAEGRAEDAVSSLRAAADKQEADGIDSVVIPAREMLADLLLALNRPVDAVKEYAATLKESPGRFDAQFGAAIAANAAGDKGSARDYAVRLQRQCAADADRPEIRQLTLVIDKRWPH